MRSRDTNHCSAHLFLRKQKARAAFHQIFCAKIQTPRKRQGELVLAAPSGPVQGRMPPRRKNILSGTAKRANGSPIWTVKEWHSRAGGPST